ncbi:MAG: hypothetical protein UR26_C0003G0103 [candidate division TM6 bacterium GW2011_GWF2_32_72]|nr:MAG: hypothetical protein UR26_C0003G0103 [candidate division TM6 bacterium GW2011_GWF2_32_72]
MNKKIILFGLNFLSLSSAFCSDCVKPSKPTRIGAREASAIFAKVKKKFLEKESADFSYLEKVVCKSDAKDALDSLKKRIDSAIENHSLDYYVLVIYELEQTTFYDAVAGCLDVEFTAEKDRLMVDLAEKIVTNCDNGRAIKYNSGRKFEKPICKPVFPWYYRELGLNMIPRAKFKVYWDKDRSRILHSDC